MAQIRVQVLGCHDLVRSDGFANTGKTDPYVVIGLLPGKTDTDAAEKRIKLNQTAVVENNINPEFPENYTTFDLDRPEQRVYFDVYDQDPGKDDRTCGLKTTVAELMSGPPTPHKVTFPLKKKGGYKIQSCEPTIDLFIYPPERQRIPIGDIWNQQDQWEPYDRELRAIVERNNRKGEPIAKLNVKGDNQYDYNLLIVDLDEKDYYVTENSVPSYVQKGENSYEFTDLSKNLLIVPFIQTHKEFNAGQGLEFTLGEVAINQQWYYRGEFSLAVVRLQDGKFTQVNTPALHRKNYTNQQWVDAFPEDVLPKDEYHEK